MNTDTESEERDVVVIGAGLYGIAAARTYLEVHPSCRLTVLDQDSSVGGSWNARRNYETFWSQTGLRMTEYSDMPLQLPSNEETYHDTFQAKHVTQYLQTYVENHVYAGQSIRDRMLFNFKVQSVARIGDEDSWTIRGVEQASQKPRMFVTPKVMIATGVTSEPNMPVLPGKETFGASIIHSEGFGQSAVLTSPDIQNVVVVGGGKSAADMVYACAKRGKSVSWIIRKSGTGPAAFIDIKGRGSGLLAYKNAAEIGCTRMMTSLGPSAFTEPTWKSAFLHRNKIGRAIGEKVWQNADRDIRKEANYHGRDESRKGFENLETDTKAYWCSGAVGLLQHRDFWDTVAKDVDAHREDISRLEPNSIILQNGAKIPCDVLLCGTGWKQSYPFFTDTQLCELGLPHSLEFHCLDDAVEWAMLQEAADKEVLAEYPKLAQPPAYYQKTMTKTPYRLYKCMAPLDDDRIVFLGQIRIANNFRVAECQALWAVALLDGRLDLPVYEDMQGEIAYVNAWCKRRYPANGAPGNYMHYDVIAYTDALLAELGLKSHRKSTWFKDFFSPCLANDLKDLIAEYKGKVEREERESKPLHRVRTRTDSMMTGRSC